MMRKVIQKNTISFMNQLSMNICVVLTGRSINVNCSPARIRYDQWPLYTQQFVVSNWQPVTTYTWLNKDINSVSSQKPQILKIFCIPSCQLPDYTTLFNFHKCKFSQLKTILLRYFKSCCH